MGVALSGAEGSDYALSIARNEFNHVVLECRHTESCLHSRIVRALGFTNEHVYAETPDWLISRLRDVKVHEAEHKVPDVGENHEHGPASTDGASGAVDDSSSCDEERTDAKLILAIDDSALPVTSEDTSGTACEHASLVQVLTSVASRARLFRSSDGRFYAGPVGDRLEIFGLKSAAFRDWLVHGYLLYQPEPPSQVAIRRVVGMLEARARFEADIPEVFVRTGRDGDGEGSSYFLDLGDRSGTAIAIRDRGWLAVDRPDVHFRRPEGILPLPMPSRDGSIDLLRPYVNLTETDFRLMVTWLTAVLRPVGPYPILVLSGEQATAKSTLVKVLRLLIDPHTCIALESADEHAQPDGHGRQWLAPGVRQYQ